jgi:cytochrome c553
MSIQVKTAVKLWLLGVILGASGAALAGQSMGEMHAQSCGGCHGTQGRLEVDRTFMPLAGMPADEFVRAMIDFRDGRRPSTLMGSIALGYSDQEISDMASYYQSVSR